MSATEKKRLNPSLAARVGQVTRTARKTFEMDFEDISEEARSAAGLQPGETALVDLEFTWIPYGWGAMRSWVEQAMRSTPDIAQTASYMVALKNIIQSSNFGLEKADYSVIHPEVMEWVVQETGLKAKGADAKKSTGSGKDDPLTEQGTTLPQTHNSSPTTPNSA